MDDFHLDLTCDQIRDFLQDSDDELFTLITTTLDELQGKALVSEDGEATLKISCTR